MNPDKFYDVTIEVAIIRPDSTVGQVVHPAVVAADQADPVLKAPATVDGQSYEFTDTYS